MSIINCPECNKKISDQAPTCPECGYPMAANQGPVSHSRKVITIEKTSQKYKIQMIASIALMLLSMISCIIFFPSLKSSNNNISGPMQVGALMFWAGLIWFIVVRILAWWHHG